MKIEINNGTITIDDNHAAKWDYPPYPYIFFEEPLFKSDRGPIEAEHISFMWQTHKGKRLELWEMATPHIWNTLKMLWNHLLKVEGDYRYYLDIKTWAP